MSTTAEEFLKSFDLLPEVEKHKVVMEILRWKYPSLTDEALAFNAEEVFLELDRRKSEDAQSQSGRRLVS